LLETKFSLVIIYISVFREVPITTAQPKYRLYVVYICWLQRMLVLHRARFTTSDNVFIMPYTYSYVKHFFWLIYYITIN